MFQLLITIQFCNFCSFTNVELTEFGKLRADGEFAEIHGDFVYYTKFFRSVSYMDQHVVDVLYEIPRFVVNNQGLRSVDERWKVRRADLNVAISRSKQESGS